MATVAAIDQTIITAPPSGSWMDLGRARSDMMICINQHPGRLPARMMRFPDGKVFELTPGPNVILPLPMLLPINVDSLTVDVWTVVWRMLTETEVLTESEIDGVLLAAPRAAFPLPLAVARNMWRSMCPNDLDVFFL